MGNARARVAESLDELRALDAEIVAWRDSWGNPDAIKRHRTQLDIIAGLTYNLITILGEYTSRIDPTADVATVYAECRQADERVHYVRKLWRYYADKFDQRAGSGDGQTARTLRAADEVIWSCWKTALQSFGTAPGPDKPAPLPYLSPQFAATTAPRTEYPSDLRPGLRSVFIEHVEQLSIPVIALPSGCQRRPWWLVVAAHEVGHHVQWILPGVRERTEQAITAAVDGRLAAVWPKWHTELFADACAVLLTGRAFVWAVTELVRGAPEDPRYPPPRVRLAVALAVAANAGLLNCPAADREIPDLGSRLPGDYQEADIAELLRSVPAVADALLGVTSENGAELRRLASATVRARDEDVISYWERILLTKGMPVPEESLGAARFCVAGSVAAWQSVVGMDNDDEEFAAWTEFLAGQVRAVLPDCAEPGKRGLGETDVAPRAEELARRFAADLCAVDLLSGDQLAVEELTGGAGRP